ncbi:MAG: NAD(P)/FAD-dependent oxidoreductase [Chthoniobacterales bacterium]|nr:NAD(P)/FAD-dependent oxidoreductase [Chthoniobacterales bacterium]
MEARGIENLYIYELKAIAPSDKFAVLLHQKENGKTEEIRIHYDLLHPMPKFQTPAPLRKSPLTAEGLGGQGEVNSETLQHKRYKNVFALGDSSPTGAPKTAATIRKQAPVVAENLIDSILELPPKIYTTAHLAAPC